MAVSKSKGTEPLISHHFNNIKYGNTAIDKKGRVQSVFSMQVEHPKLNKGKPTLIPSVYNGKVLSRKEAVQAAIDSGIKWTSANSHEDLREYDIKIHERMSPSLGEKTDREAFNRGGTVALQEQMSMFDEGGMLDEGDTVDPVSGNDVPVGALKEEVRDDVDAKVSPGEYVVSAATVRYHGLDTFMKLRDEAIRGMARMEAIGQMGNSDDAELDPDTPFSQDDLVIVMGGKPEDGEPMKANRGSFVLPTPADLGEDDPQQPAFANGGVVSNSLVQTSLDNRNDDTLVKRFGAIVPYITPEGEVLLIPVTENGTPLISLPAGSVLASTVDEEIGTDDTNFVQDPEFLTADRPRGDDDNEINAPDFGDGSWDIHFVNDDGTEKGLAGRIQAVIDIMGNGGAQQTGWETVTDSNGISTIRPTWTNQGGFGDVIDMFSPVMGLTPETLIPAMLSGTGIFKYAKDTWLRGPEKTNPDGSVKFIGQDVRENDDKLENLDPTSETNEQEIEKLVATVKNTPITNTKNILSINAAQNKWNNIYGERVISPTDLEPPFVNPDDPKKSEPLNTKIESKELDDMTPPPNYDEVTRGPKMTGLDSVDIKTGQQMSTLFEDDPIFIPDEEPVEETRTGEPLNTKIESIPLANYDEVNRGPKMTGIKPSFITETAGISEVAPTTNEITTEETSYSSDYEPPRIHGTDRKSYTMGPANSATDTDSAIKPITGYDLKGMSGPEYVDPLEKFLQGLKESREKEEEEDTNKALNTTYTPPTPTTINDGYEDTLVKFDTGKSDDPDEWYRYTPSPILDEVTRGATPSPPILDEVTRGAISSNPTATTTSTVTRGIPTLPPNSTEVKDWKSLRTSPTTPTVDPTFKSTNPLSIGNINKDIAKDMKAVEDARKAKAAAQEETRTEYPMGEPIISPEVSSTTLKLPSIGPIHPWEKEKKEINEQFRRLEEESKPVSSAEYYIKTGRIRFVTPSGEVLDNTPENTAKAMEEISTYIKKSKENENRIKDRINKETELTKKLEGSQGDDRLSGDDTSRFKTDFYPDNIEEGGIFFDDTYGGEEEENFVDEIADEYNADFDMDFSEPDIDPIDPDTDFGFAKGGLIPRKYNRGGPIVNPTSPSLVSTSLINRTGKGVGGASAFGTDDTTSSKSRGSFFIKPDYLTPSKSLKGLGDKKTSYRKGQHPLSQKIARAYIPRARSSGPARASDIMNQIARRYGIEGEGDGSNIDGGTRLQEAYANLQPYSKDILGISNPNLKKDLDAYWGQQVQLAKPIDKIKNPEYTTIGGGFTGLTLPEVEKLYGDKYKGNLTIKDYVNELTANERKWINSEMYASLGIGEEPSHLTDRLKFHENFFGPNWGTDPASIELHKNKSKKYIGRPIDITASLSSAKVGKQQALWNLFDARKIAFFYNHGMYPRPQYLEPASKWISNIRTDAGRARYAAKYPHLKDMIYGTTSTNAPNLGGSSSGSTNFVPDPVFQTPDNPRGDTDNTISVAKGGLIKKRKKVKKRV